jgi:hypothetical protein
LGRYRAFEGGDVLPTYFIIGTKIEKPKLYISQQSLEIVMESLRNYCHIPLRFSVFGLSTSAGGVNDYSPSNCALLEPVAHLEPDNSFQYYINIAANEIDKLPAEQACEELQKALDFLQHRLKDNERVLPEMVK